MANVQRGITRLVVALTVIVVALGVIAGALAWQHATDRWSGTLVQPAGDPLILIGSGFGYMRVNEGTPPQAIRARIDGAKAIPGEGRLLDCTAEWVDAGTDWQHTGCQNVPMPESPLPVAYIYQWGDGKKLPSALFSRRAISEAEDSGQLPLPVKRAVGDLRAVGRWSSASKRPNLRISLMPVANSLAVAVAVWLMYVLALWILRGFRA